MTKEEIINALRKKASKNEIEKRQKKFGIISQNSLGVTQKHINEIIKGIKKNKPLAIALYETGIYEAKMICGKLFPPKELSEELMDNWTKEFNTWEICDTFCLKLYGHSPLAIPKIFEWTQHSEEFVKRAGFATIASICMADKTSTNEIFEPFFHLIVRESQDDRHYVKKGVNWALRSLGKRNQDLRTQAIEISKMLSNSNHSTAKWIGNDALKELTHKNVRIANYPRKLNRNY